MDAPLRIDLTPPSEPANVVTTAGIASSLVATPNYTVVWNKSKDLESDVVDYELQEKMDTSPVWTSVPVTIQNESTKSKAALTNRTGGHIYYYQVVRSIQRCCDKRDT